MKIQLLYKHINGKEQMMNKDGSLIRFCTKALALAAVLLPLIGIGNLHAQDLYVSSYSNSEVLRYDGTTGDFIDAFVTEGSGDLRFPTGLTFGPDGNLYVSSNTTSTVLEYDGATGDFKDTFVTEGSGGLLAPTYLVFHGTTSAPAPAGSSGNGGCSIAGTPGQSGTALADILILLLPAAMALSIRAIRRRKNHTPKLQQPFNLKIKREPRLPFIRYQYSLRQL